MASKIKGIIVEIGGDTSALEKALKDVDKESSNLSKELKGVNTLLNFDPKNTEILTQKQDLLNKSISTTSNKLEQLQKLKNEADKSISNGNKISEENYRNLQREIAATQNKIKKLTNELKDFNSENNKLNIASKNLQVYGNKITDISNKVDDLGNKASILSGTILAGTGLAINNALNVDQAISKYIATTNTAISETDKYKNILEEIYKNNYGESYEDIADAMSQVKIQLNDISISDLKNITEKSIALRDLFGYDISESIRSVKSLIDNFNVSADEAFNLISEGKKQGLDFSNELLDSINEYSVQFKKLGLSVEDMFNIFKIGADNGAFNLDKIGDAIKEFSIRVIDGSDTTSDGFKRIGLNVDEMSKKFASGGQVAKQAFIEVVNRLSKMDDKVSQSIAGVDLFGTMWEDLGPEVISSFQKMDSGISKSSSSMQDSIDSLHDNTKNKIEIQIRRLSDVVEDLGEDFLPIIEKVIDKVEDFVSSLDNMSDEEKENALKIALLVASLGPFLKILGTTGKAIGSVTKGIGTFTQALNVASGKTTSTSKSINSLASVLSFLMSPVGIAVAGIAALVAILSSATAEYKKGTEEVKKYTDAINNEIDSRLNMTNSINKDMNARLSEISNVERLKKELNSLVDANGNVNSSYKSRVDFILNELNSALGTEYKRTGDIIDNYKELINTIDDVILKKKAEIVLDADKEKYSEAIKNYTTAQEEYLKVEDQLIDKKKEINELDKKFNESVNDLVYTSLYLSKRNELVNQYNNLSETLKNSESEIKSYIDNINRYEENSRLVLEGGEENYKKVFNSIFEIQTKTTKLEGTEFQKRLKNAQDNYNKTSKIYLLEQEMNKNKNENIYQNDLDRSYKSLKLLAEELVAMSSTTEKFTPEIVSAWKDLANNSRDVYDEILSQLPKDMQEKINQVTGVINADTTVPKAIFDLSQKAVSEANVKNDFQKSGEEWIEGIKTGINNKKSSVLGVIDSIALQSLKSLNKAWDINSPSKETEKSSEFFMEGILKGLENKEKNIYTEVENFSRKLLDKFNKINTNSSSFNKSLQNDLNNSVNTVLKEKVFSPNITINTKNLNEIELNRILNYVNKNFGNLY